MVDISSQNNKINITVSSSGNTANTNVTPDYAQYYSEKSKEWAISNRIVDNTDYSSKYYANESKKQADISTAKTTEVVESGNTAVSNIENARDNAITNIISRENVSVDNVNTAGATQVANVNSAGTTQINLAKEQVVLATNQANVAKEQATIATNKTSEVVASGNEALSNIDTAKNNAITSITNQETTSKTSLIDEGATQIGLIQNEGATQVANVQSTGFYMRDDKLYFINSQGEETEFKSGGSGLEVCDIGMALYVDETKGLRRYLNGQIVDINTNTQAFLNRLKQITTLHPSLLCTEEEWQTAKTMSAFGQVGKFVFNYSGDDIVSVRLPRVVNVQGLLDLSQLGLTVGAGLPNITGRVRIPLYFDRVNEGAFYVSANGGKDYGSNDGGYIAGFDASRSSSIYGSSDTVQEESILYPYFIQIATGSETENNIVNEIELNNPYSFGDSKYSSVALNNLSWLKSEGQNNPKGTYPSYYDWILENVNKGEKGFKLSTASDITDYDFVINTTDKTFRLPLKNGMESMFMKQAPVVGNGKTLGLTSGSAYAGLSASFQESVNYPQTVMNYTSLYGVRAGTASPSNASRAGIQGVSLGITTDPSNSGLVADLSNVTVPLGWNLYYYVGETVQNANLIDAGRIGEILPTKTDKVQAARASMPSNKSIKLTIGAAGSDYTAPAAGYFSGFFRANNQVNLVYLTVAAKQIATEIGNVPTDSNLCLFLPVAKNDVCRLGYTGISTDPSVSEFYFIYAEGSKEV